MKVVLVDKNADSLKKAADALGGHASPYLCDVSKLDEWRALKSCVEMEYGKVDFLMLNAGIGLKSGWEDTEYFHKVHD